ncbi:HAD-IIIC family phosphatase [Dokdonia ponticola]|uniref:HAD-IIIC family phosphatase n=1 Tax=Dokdonia ponticola TaxID=2041041 RepID=A0ABV9HRE1_9FLAO
MKDFLQLKKNLKKDVSNLPTIRVSVLGDTSTQFLTQALKGLGYDHGYYFDIQEADFNQIQRQVYDACSELYAHQPEIVILFQSSHKLLEKYNKTALEAHTLLASDELQEIENLYHHLTSKLDTTVIYYNYTEIDDAVFGNYSNKIASSFLFQLRKLNYELMLFVAEKPNVHLVDLSSIQNHVGKTHFFQPKIYINTEMVLSIEVLPRVASKTIDVINSLQGKSKKCLVLDLDNTLWGGVIGDDGIENIQIGHLGIGKAFSKFQHWVKKLKERGVIIAICSKNTDSVAKKPFEEHPDMVLRLPDISVFVANWENKADNIRHIQRILQIGFDSMVFLDDNPFERNMVREHIPQICVPELPDDPADYLEYLYSQHLFETNSFSNEDKERTKQYQISAKRARSQQKFTNEDDFLLSLNMLSKVEPFNEFNAPRVAQLSQRSNQFNLRTVRYTHAEITKLSTSKEHLTFTFTLEDTFGDSGLVCVVILKKENDQTLFIDSWFMSCRVLKRGMECFVLNTIVNSAIKSNFTTIKGEYIPTLKNEIVKDHYQDLGFKKQGEYWVIHLANYPFKDSFVTKKDSL